MSSSLKVLYIANVRMPTEKAHGIQIMKTCEAFKRAGIDIELVVPTRNNPITAPAFAYYGMHEAFPITYLRTPDTVSWGMPGFLLQTALFGVAARRYVRSKKPDLVYGRDERVLAGILSGGIPVVWETHTGAWNAAARTLGAGAKKIVSISGGLSMAYQQYGIPAERIVVAHDGVDLEDFARTEGKAESRARLGLPADALVAAYIGRLDAEKGAPTFFAASELLGDSILAVVIGGMPGKVSSLKTAYPKVRFLGHRPYRELPDNQAAVDILVLPNSGTKDVSARFTSPLKLFTAMASGIPIVASGVPSIMEILDDSTAYLVAPDNAEALAAAILKVIQEPEIALGKARTARRRVEAYTWDARVQIILASLGHPV